MKRLISFGGAAIYRRAPASLCEYLFSPKGYNATWPLAILIATSDRVSIWTPLGRYHLARSEVVSIVSVKQLLGVSLRIEHNREELPGYIVYQPLFVARVIHHLATLGYSIRYD